MEIKKVEKFNSSKISLNRQILNWEWYTEPKTAHLFIYCLLRANFQPVKYRGILIKRGQFITGRKKASIDTGLSEQEIRTALKHLELTNEITKEQIGSYTVITVNKYNEYQQNNNQPNHQFNQDLTNDQPRPNQDLTTNNNDNNDNNDNNEYIYTTHMGKFLNQINKDILEEKLLFKQYGIYKNVILNEKQYSWLFARVLDKKLLDELINELSNNIASARDKDFDFEHLDMHKLRIDAYFKHRKMQRKSIKTEEKKEEKKKTGMLEDFSDYKPWG